jgi:hypothetical protein
MTERPVDCLQIQIPAVDPDIRAIYLRPIGLATKDLSAISRILERPDLGLHPENRYEIDRVLEGAREVLGAIADAAIGALAAVKRARREIESLEAKLAEVARRE